MNTQGGEQPLINGGSCNLASINLSKLAVNPFTDKAYVDFDKLKYLTDLGIRYLDEVVDDNIKNQPLEIQKQMAEKYRNCGLGFLGLSDLLIKMGYEYGKEESISLVDKIGRTMIEQALLTSTQLAEEKGAFPGCNVDAILQAPFVQENATEEILERIQNYGLRNSSLLSIAPTGLIN